MKINKNWFYQFCTALSIIGILFILISVFSIIGEGQEYPYLHKGLLIIEIFAAWLIIQILASLTARFEITKKLLLHKKWINIIEAIFVIIMLSIAIIIRVVVINTFPMEPASDYKTYYEIAVLLKEGTIQTLGKGYSDYIAMFPHVMGYCYILKTAFVWFGTSILVGQYLNVFFAVSTIFFLYRIARKLGGRLTGLLALIFSTFWISQVLYVTMLSAEYAFTFFLYGSIWLFISLLNNYDGNTQKSRHAIILHLLLGALIAITSAIRPMGVILLIAIILCILPQKMKLPNIPRNDIPLTKRMLEKGWIRCVLIIIPYFIISGIITTNIEIVVDKTLPSATTSFGYNMLVGLNVDSIGGWNEEDANLLNDSMEATGSATEAHIICRDLAFTRLTNNPKELFNLIVHKYELLWGNDDYGSTWNIVFADEQGTLTNTKSDFLYKVRHYNNIIYAIVIFFSIIALIYLLQRDGSGAYVLLLVYLGTAAAHLIVESQNRYHYFVLQIFMFFAALGIGYIFKDEQNKRISLLYKKEEEHLLKEEEQRMLTKYDNLEKKAVELIESSMVNTFDMEAALKHGHVIMTVTPAYEKNKKANKNGKDDEKTI